MRKQMISAVFSAITLASAFAFAADFPGDALLSFSTQGPDRYADGTIVADGECYALVWFPAGGTFSGFNADGTVVSEEDRVILAASLAQDGKCRDTLFQIPAATYQALKDGEWAVCLVDTRLANGVPAGVQDGQPVRVNRWGMIESAVTVQSASPLAALRASTASNTLRSSNASRVCASQLSAVPASTKRPRITGMFFSGGKVWLTVENTEPYLTYTVGLGSSPGDILVDRSGCLVDGETGAEIVLEADATCPSLFYNVSRAE